jgi:hypothetical protein
MNSPQLWTENTKRPVDMGFLRPQDRGSLALTSARALSPRSEVVVLDGTTTTQPRVLLIIHSGRYATDVAEPLRSASQTGS